jgi:cobyrinic acid a,c-diamide synthase
MSFIIAAPSSGSGKTTVTLGLLRAFAQDGLPFRAAKSGPDYIDPRFHALASNRTCINLDAWAMSPARLASLVSGDADLIIEGAMGLFDGAPPLGKGATADLARQFQIPVVLVIDAGKQAQSVAALAHGFCTFDPTINIAGVILNNVGSPRHDKMLQDALGRSGIAVLGSIPRDPNLKVPSRHLGLVQAQEHPDIESYLDKAARIVRDHVDLDALRALNQVPFPAAPAVPVAPPAQTIAIAQDAAFAFAYPHLLNDWQSAGAALHLFSPLNNDPVPDADFVYLPGGYPELHAGRLANNSTFINSLHDAAQSADIYGECGGYMLLGDALTDAKGTTHKMAGLLPLETSFATRKLHLGYRNLNANAGPFAGKWKAHEFHYATTVLANGVPLFEATDATDSQLAPMGLIQGRVSGSFAHIIDAA